MNIIFVKSIVLMGIITHHGFAQPVPTFTPIYTTTQQNMGLFSRNNPEFRGSIKIDGKFDPVPHFRVIYEGKETMSNTEGFFTIPLDQNNLDKFALIICRATDLKHEFDKKNTIKSVSIRHNKPYRYFTFRKLAWSNSWHQQEMKLNNRNTIFPEHSVIVLADPKIVEKIESWDIDLPAQIIKLPRIVLKQETDPKESAHSLLRSLNNMCFHETIEYKTQVAPNNPKVKISMAQ